MNHLRTIICCACCALAVILPNVVSANCKSGEKVIDIAKGAPAKGDTVSGPCDITVTNHNVARYDYSFDATVSFSTAPDLWSKLTSINAADAATPPKATPDSAPSDKATHPQDKTLTGTHIAALSRSTRNAAGAAPSPLKALTDAANDALSDSDDLLEQGNNKISELTAAGTPLREEGPRYNSYQELRRTAARATSAVSAAGRALNNFLLQSDSDIKTGGYKALFDKVTALLAATPASTFVTGVGAAWPTPLAMSGIRTQVENSTPGLQSALQSFTEFKTVQDQALVTQRDILIAAKADIRKAAAPISDPVVVNDMNRLRADLDRHITRIELQRASLATLLQDLNTAVKRDTDILAGLPDIETSGKNYTDFVAAQDALRQWQGRLSGLLTTWNAHQTDAHPFPMTFSADCHFAFSRTKTTVVNLVPVDKLPGATTNPSPIALATVECTTPFSVSAGVAFSTIGEKQFAIQAIPTSSTTTENRIVQTSDSSIHPLPLGMVHVRLWEPTDIVSVHGSFGIAGNLKSDAAGGSSADFLLGPSVSLFRTMFFTPGLYFGQQASLANGFNTTSAVPASITQPPLQKSYKPAFAFAITFTKP